MRFGETRFYNTKNLSMDEKRSMFYDCKDVSYMWHADILDCNVSMSRQHLDCSFDEILGHLKDDAYVVVIDRGTWGGPAGENREHFEIGFRRIDAQVDYFLFIQVDSDKMPPILEKYKLEPIKR